MAAANPLEKAHAQGLQDNKEIGRLFRRLGSLNTPNTDLLKSFRLARRALRDTLTTNASLGETKTIFRQLRGEMRRAVEPIFTDAIEKGYQSAYKQLGYYSISQPEPASMALEIGAAYDVIDTSLKKKEAAVTALLLTNGNTSLIVGDDSRQGLMTPFEIIGAAAFWVASLYWNSFAITVDRARSPGIRKQAIAALDERTTLCCLEVHAQVVDLSAPFHLTGTPRFADEIDWPPFHYYCRTSGALYLPAYDDGLTEAMRADASTVLEERARGHRPERHPASALI